MCRIRCDDGLRFSQPVPQVYQIMFLTLCHDVYITFAPFQFYTCGAEGFWRPNPSGASSDPATPFSYPSCSVARPAQKIFKIRLDYLTDVLCNDAGKV